MVVFPNCKINLGLTITGKREDGFHDIETVFYPVPLNDALEIIISNISHPEVTFSTSGIAIAGADVDNLCIKAYHLLKKDFPLLPSIKIHLHKAIPIGAGLGGGSADAAFTLKALNEKFELGISNSQLLAYALQLGSDCPFFINNNSCIATGRGENMQPCTIDLSSYQLILINPGIHINTGWAFSQLNIATENSVNDSSLIPINEIITTEIEGWKNLLKNDFEKPVFSEYPIIKEIKENLYAQGALFALMSGSGSSVYGIFKKNFQPSFKFPATYLQYSMLL